MALSSQNFILPELCSWKFMKQTKNLALCSHGYIPESVYSQSLSLMCVYVGDGWEGKGVEVLERGMLRRFLRPVFIFFQSLPSPQTHTLTRTCMCMHTHINTPVLLFFSLSFCKCTHRLLKVLL